MTLTSSPISPKDIHRSFRTFVKRVRRKHGSFEYIAVKELTKTGLAHLHILYRGAFMPQAWISTTWQEVHQARITYVEEVRGNLKQVSNYLAKYIVSEGERFWWSWNWVYRGFVRDWKAICKENGYRMQDAIDAWRARLWRLAIAGWQTELDGG